MAKTRSHDLPKAAAGAVAPVEEAPWQPKQPYLLNCTPDGFVPHLTANMLLCSANLDYFLADAIVPPLRAIGIGTPNKITYFNVVVRAICMHYLVNEHSYAIVAAIFFFSQVLDCADGQCARRYKLGSEFGAWLDHTTDTIFLAVFSIAALYLIGEYHGYDSVQCWGMIPLFCIMGALGRATIFAKENNKVWKDYTFLEAGGMYQELFMSYIFVLLIWAAAAGGSLPP
jgi:hypothetical protein